MKTKYLILLLLFLLHRTITFGQKENNIWTFGHHLGLDFNGGGSAPVFSVSKSDTWEGCASVCNSTGNLLFYCDGKNVYDRTHTVMPNGSGILGSITSTQGVAIAKVRGHDSLYYLFVNNTNASPISVLSYSIINMNLNGGKGDVDPSAKNIVLLHQVSEKMIIAGNCNQWLIVHHISSPIFYAFDLFSTPLTPKPVISVVGTARGKADYEIGEMKIDMSFKTIALSCMWRTNGMELYDFNKNTGVVSNHRTLDSSLDIGKLWL